MKNKHIFETFDDFVAKRNDELQEKYTNGFDDAMLEVVEIIEENESLELISESINVYFQNTINETTSSDFDKRLQKSYNDGFKVALKEVSEMIKKSESLQYIYEMIVGVLEEIGKITPVNQTPSDLPNKNQNQGQGQQKKKQPVVKPVVKKPIPDPTGNRGTKFDITMKSRN